MVKKITCAALICILLVTTFVVPSFAWVNNYLVLGDDSAFFYLPPYTTYAIKSDNVPVSINLSDVLNKPMIKFQTVSVYEITGTTDGDVYYFQDETLYAPTGHYYGITIYEMEVDGEYVILCFYLGEYYDTSDGEAILVDVIYEDYLANEEYPTIDIAFYAQDIISDPTNMPDYFKFFYPYLPMVWTEYSKIIVGTYDSGYADGERAGRQRVNLQAVNEAFERGKAQGYDEGYNVGFYDAGGKNYFKELVDAVIFAPVNGIVEMMNFDFFGINVANFFLALLTILILAGILAVIARFIL